MYVKPPSLVTPSGLHRRRLHIELFGPLGCQHGTQILLELPRLPYRLAYNPRVRSSSNYDELPDGNYTPRHHRASKTFVCRRTLANSVALWAVASFACALNFTGGLLARFEGLILILHLVGFFGILVPLVYFSDHNSAEAVFTTLYDNGGWHSDGLTFLVGLASIISTLTGAGCAVHMSEEIQSAATVVPKALLYTISINGTLAFAMAIAFLFCITDLDAAVAAADTMFYPFLQVFQSAVGSTAGACVMASLIPILALASSIRVYATSSRMIWSFAR
ncbi:Uu.00g094750.m01.CDS01 [Anthostomella pinea]|uniref:Uu.00g094750.m01.CDS01 n=1 Tax=Anthostomella pinea TaxID=933095 RepID=A0AAI8VNP3_9PEZI|nr:Uu.00g094750.m01.CDS01 [Anthostomella pinea]